MTLMTKISGTSIASGIALGALAVLSSSNAVAAPVVNFEASVTGGSPNGSPYIWSQLALPHATPGWWQVEESHVGSPFPTGISGPGNEWLIEWNITADDDPNGPGASAGQQITSGFTAYNNLEDTGVAGVNNLTFSLMVEIAVSPVLGSVFFGGGGMTLTVPGDVPQGAINQISAVGLPIYTALVNGVAVADIYQPPFNLGASGGGTNSISAGWPAPQLAALAGTSPLTIGIQLNFVLTPGDYVNFNGVFAFIPTPGCLAMLALAGLTGCGRRRRE